MKSALLVALVSVFSMPALACLSIGEEVPTSVIEGYAEYEMFKECLDKVLDLGVNLDKASKKRSWNPYIITIQGKDRNDRTVRLTIHNVPSFGFVCDDPTYKLPKSCGRKI